MKTIFVVWAVGVVAMELLLCILDPDKAVWPGRYYLKVAVVWPLFLGVVIPFVIAVLAQKGIEGLRK